MNDSQSFVSSDSSSKISSRKEWKGEMKKSMYIPIAVVLVFVLFAIFLIVNALNNGNKSSASPLNNIDSRIDVQKPKAQETLNKTYEFPVKDGSGIEVTKLKFDVQNVELRDQIIVKGQKATAVEGRTFLIVNMKITNSYDKSVQIPSRDYFRLTINNTGEKLAPDIHNDPVEIQADSTKYTRVGFPINDTDKNLALVVGEISGKKDTIKLNLK